MSSISGVSSSNNAWAALSSQRAQHQAKMFAKVDSDGSGSVDQTELDTMLSDISQKTGTSFGDTKELFSKMDSNGDGTLSSDELAKGMKDLMPPPTTMEFAQSRGANGQGSEDDLFSKIDANGDGSIDSTELKALTDKIKSDTGKDVSDQFSKLDTNGDGNISKAEFDAGRPQHSDSTEHAHASHGAGGPPPVGGPGGADGASGAGGASASSSTTYDPLDTNQDGTVSEMERLAGALKDLAQASNNDDGTSGSGNSEIAKLAQKLYEQIENINNNLASNDSSNTTISTTLLSTTA